MTVVKDLAGKLTTDWADIDALTGVNVIATERILDRLTTPTVQLRGIRITPTPEVPLSHRSVGVLLTVVSPYENLDTAADQLEPVVWAILDYLDKRFQHEDATNVGYGDRLAYDIPITVITKKE